MTIGFLRIDLRDRLRKRPLGNDRSQRART
jgi:hypothetical protein